MSLKPTVDVEWLKDKFLFGGQFPAALSAFHRLLDRKIPVPSNDLGYDMICREIERESRQNPFGVQAQSPNPGYGPCVSRACGKCPPCLRYQGVK